MLKNYIKIALRSLRKRLAYSLINVIGLSIGLTCFIFIGLFVHLELSYDSFHEKSDRIYRIEESVPEGAYMGVSKYAVTPAPMANVLMEEFPEVEHAVYIDDANALIEYEESGFYEYGLWATEHFFEVFDFRLLQGNPNTALVNPNSIVLTETLAHSYFGDASRAMNEVLAVTLGNEQVPMTVTGIVQDPPTNSHIQFNYILPFSSSGMYRRNREDWGTSTSYTYASLAPGHSLSVFTDKLADLINKYDDNTDDNEENAVQQNFYYPLPLTDIHLKSDANFQLGVSGDIRGVSGDIRYVYLFSAIALLILLIACINYINLTTAQSATRVVELGVRKVMGAERRQLVGQFMSEAILPSLLALGIAILLVILLLPTFNVLTSRDITLSLEENGAFLALLTLIGLGVGILSGSYPAVILSGAHPVRMMKKQLEKRAGKSTFRNVLVTTQFAVTIVLIIGTIVIQRQLHYIQNANLGVNRTQIVSIPIRDASLYEQFDVIKQTLERQAEVLGVTASEKDPTMIDLRAMARGWEGAAEDEEVFTYFTPIQHGFVNLFEIDLVEGRDFSEAVTTDATESMIINETLKRQLGWDTAVGKRFNFYNREARIIGVVEDFQFHTFRQEISPLVLFIEEDYFLRILVKIRGENVPQTIDLLQETMAGFSPDYPLEYYFLDDAYNQMYQRDIRLGSLLSYFTFLALLIACLGLLGLATFTAQRRTKEIGVRKILGASLSDILVLMTRDYTRLVLFAFMLAAPIGYLATHKWLEEFAYRISIGWGTFLLAGIAVLLIAWMTVSFQVVRVGLLNPVKSLRHD